MQAVSVGSGNISDGEAEDLKADFYQDMLLSVTMKATGLVYRQNERKPKACTELLQ